jgi:hypothetical protein
MVARVKKLQSGFCSFNDKRPGVMRHTSAAATMDQTDIRGLATTLHRSVMEAASR